MSGLASPSHAHPGLRPPLRPVPDAEAALPRAQTRELNPEPAHRALAARRPHVLIAGADRAARARMLEDLRELLPNGTRFLEAHETWELLACAAGSRMVVLTDDLGYASSESLVRLLGRRHPTLPVLAVGSRAALRVSAGANAASL